MNDNGIDKRTRELEKQAAVCDSSWVAQKDFNKEIEEEIADLRDFKSRAGVQLFGMVAIGQIVATAIVGAVVWQMFGGQ